MIIHFVLAFTLIILLAMRIDPLIDSLQAQTTEFERYSVQISGLGNIDPEDQEALEAFTESVQDADALRSAHYSFVFEVIFIFLLFAAVLSLLLPKTYAKEKYWKLAGAFAVVTLAIIGIGFIYFIIASIVVAQAGFTDTSGGLMVLIFLVILSILIVLYPIAATFILKRKQNWKFTAQVHGLAVTILAALSVFVTIVLPPVANHFQIQRNLSAMFLFFLVLLLLFAAFSYVLSYEKQALLTGKLFK